MLSPQQASTTCETYEKRDNKPLGTTTRAPASIGIPWPVTSTSGTSIIHESSAITNKFGTGAREGKIDSEPEVSPDEEELDSEGTESNIA
jgi:hypothetical protein